MPYQLAVLDFDGVILNSEPYHFTSGNRCWQNTVPERSMTLWTA